MYSQNTPTPRQRWRQTDLPKQHRRGLSESASQRQTRRSPAPQFGAI